METPIEVLGHPMLLDADDALGLAIHGIYEPLITGFVKKEIKRGSLVLDIGANIGYYTLIFAELVGSSGKVVAFEPEASCFSILEENVAMNNCVNVVLEEKAISDVTGKIMLYLSTDNNGDHRIYDSHDGRSCVEVEAIGLDDYFQDYEGSVNFIKMDIQGAEPLALKGMCDLLAKTKELKMVTEFWPLALKMCGFAATEYADMLEACGFRLFHINDQEHRIVPFIASNLLEVYTLENGYVTNLLCMRP